MHYPNYICHFLQLTPLSANLTKWSNKLNQFVSKLPTNCLSVFDHFVGLALKGLIRIKHCYRKEKDTKDMSY